MTAHTPGPWEIIGRNIYQIDEVGGREIIHGSGIKGRGDKLEAEANARFIVTACNCHADLLEALNGILRVASVGKSIWHIQKIASQAIRKAEE